jgi:predicted nucleic acid-binding protein
MRVFFDTNVLVAAVVPVHEHHAQAVPALERVIFGRDRGFMSLHSIAEVFATLTRLRVQPRILHAEAERVIRENILANFELLPLETKDYLTALELVVNGGWGGAKIYDALLIGCAVRAGVDRIYTFDLSDFRKLAPRLENKICAPS